MWSCSWQCRAPAVGLIAEPSWPPRGACAAQDRGSPTAFSGSRLVMVARCSDAAVHPTPRPHPQSASGSGTQCPSPLCGQAHPLGWRRTPATARPAPWRSGRWRSPAAGPGGPMNQSHQALPGGGCTTLPRRTSRPRSSACLLWDGHPEPRWPMGSVERNHRPGHSARCKQGNPFGPLNCGFGARGRIRTDDLPITRIQDTRKAVTSKYDLAGHSVCIGKVEMLAPS